MYIHAVANRKHKPSYLLRTAKRVGGKVINITVANLSNATNEELAKLESLLKWRRLLRGSSQANVVDMDILSMVIAVTGFSYSCKVDFKPRLDKRFRPAKVW